MEAFRTCAFWLNGVLRHATLIHEVNHLTSISSNPDDYPQLDSRVHTLHQHFAVNPAHPSPVGLLIPKSHANFPYAFGRQRYEQDRLTRQRRKKQHKQCKDLCAERWLLETQALRPTLERTATEANAKEKAVKAKHDEEIKRYDRVLNSTRNIRDAADLDIAEASIQLHETGHLRGPVKQVTDVECNFDGDLVARLKPFRSIAFSALLRNNDFLPHLVGTTWLRSTIFTGQEFEEDNEDFPLSSLRSLPCVPLNARTVAEEGLTSALRNIDAFVIAAPYLKVARELNVTLRSNRPYNSFSLAHKERPCQIDIPPRTENDLFDMELSAKMRDFGPDIEVDVPKTEEYFNYEIFSEKVKYHYQRFGRMPNQERLETIEIQSWNIFNKIAADLLEITKERGFSFTSALSNEPHWIRSLREQYELRLLWGERKQELRAGFKVFVLDDNDRAARKKQEMAWADIGTIFPDTDVLLVSSSADKNTNAFTIGKEQLRFIGLGAPLEDNTYETLAVSSPTARRLRKGTHVRETLGPYTLQPCTPRPCTPQPYPPQPCTPRQSPKQSIDTARQREVVYGFVPSETGRYVASEQYFGTTLQLGEASNGGQGDGTVLRPPPGITKPAIDLYRRAKGLTPFVRPYMSKLAAQYENRPTMLKFKAHEDAPFGITHLDINQQPLPDVPTNRVIELRDLLLPDDLCNNGLHHHGYPPSDTRPVAAYISTARQLQPLGPNGKRPARAFLFPPHEDEIVRGFASSVGGGFVGRGYLRRAGMDTRVIYEVQREFYESPAQPWARKTYPINDLAQEIDDMDEWYDKRKAAYRAQLEHQARNGDQKAIQKLRDLQPQDPEEYSPMLVPNIPPMPNPADDVFVDEEKIPARVNLLGRFLKAAK